MMADATTGGNVEPLKIFVGGLSWDSTKESMMQYFSQFGKVADTVVMTDTTTKRPRGFGFVTFETEDGVAKALAVKEHFLDNKTIDPKPATTKGAVGASHTPADSKLTKIFIGGVQAGTTEKEVTEYFSQFGTVMEVDMKVDKESKRMRGFGFVEFADPSVVDKVVQLHFHQINNKSVEAKKAQPRAQTVGSRTGVFSAQEFGAGQDFNVGAVYGRGSNGANSPYGYYSGFPPYSAAHQQAAATQQHQHNQYYGYGQYPQYPAAGYQGDQTQYTAGQQGSAPVPAQQAQTYTSPNTFASSATRVPAGYTGTDNYPASYYMDRPQAAPTSGYQQQHFDTTQQGTNSYPRTMGQRGSYDYTTT